MSGDEREANTHQDTLTDASLQNDMRDESDLASGIEGATMTQKRAASGDEASRLQALQADVRDQDDLERDIGIQVCPQTGQFYTKLLRTSYSNLGPFKGR